MSEELQINDADGIPIKVGSVLEHLTELSEKVKS